MFLVVEKTVGVSAYTFYEPEPGYDRKSGSLGSYLALEMNDGEPGTLPGKYRIYIEKGE